MKTIPKSQSRKKFLLWSAIAVCSATVLKFLPGGKEKPKPTVKLLAQDGSLVEIDEELLMPGKKITNLEMQHWIKTNHRK